MVKRKMFLSIQLLVIGLLITTINSCIKKDDTIVKKAVVITWANPADIISGTALNATQLNATADVTGTFVYTPASGTVLSIGANQTLKVDFTPTDVVNYNAASKTVSINVTKKNPVITWANPADISSETALSAIQLNATADVTGTFVYTPASGTKLSVGDNQNLKVDFTPTDNANYNTTAKTVTINVKSLIIGDSYQGGKIAYIFQVGDPGYIAGQTHGLIASVSNLRSRWWNGPDHLVNTGATGTALGTGSLNTTYIISTYGNGTYAAKICRDYEGGGYKNWYLPSKDELNKLYLNKVAIGNFANAEYWSSTEYTNYEAWSQSFLMGAQSPHTLMDITCWVRAVRSF